MWVMSGPLSSFIRATDTFQKHTLKRICLLRSFNSESLKTIIHLNIRITRQVSITKSISLVKRDPTVSIKIQTIGFFTVDPQINFSTLVPPKSQKNCHLYFKVNIIIPLRMKFCLTKHKVSSSKPLTQQWFRQSL